MSFFHGFSSELLKLAQHQSDEQHHGTTSGNAAQGGGDEEEFFRPAAPRTERLKVKPGQSKLAQRTFQEALPFDLGPGRAGHGGKLMRYHTPYFERDPSMGHGQSLKKVGILLTGGSLVRDIRKPLSNDYKWDSKQKKYVKLAEGSTTVSGVDVGHGGKVVDRLISKEKDQRKFKRKSVLDRQYKHSKHASVKATAKGLGHLARKDPKQLAAIAKELASGPGGSVAKGVTYGAAGYSALKGLGYRDPDSRKREPLEGAVRGAAKGGAVGLLAALALRYPKLRKEVAKRVAKAQR
ncbi:MAG: hypothetical protein ACYTBJ_17885 [Planctomycetota bacterium]|jgi:hypothetical protein